MCWGDPRHLNSPSDMMTVLEQRASHSSIEWDVRTMETRLFRNLALISFHTNLLVMASIPLIFRRELNWAEEGIIKIWHKTLIAMILNEHYSLAWLPKDHKGNCPRFRLRVKQFTTDLPPMATISGPCIPYLNTSREIATLFWFAIFTRLEGSSMRINWGPPRNARAQQSFLLVPPLRFPQRALMYGSKPIPEPASDAA